MSERVDIVKFIERVCVDEYGRPVRLEWWQKQFILEPGFHTYTVAERDNDIRGIRKGDLLRKYTRMAYSMPKKNGKTDLGGYVIMFGLLGDDENPMVFAVAGDKEQAGIVGGRARKMVERVPQFKAELSFFRDRILRKDGRGEYRTLAADAPTIHGENASITIFDEIWQYQDYSQFEGLTLSPSRREPLQVIFSYVPVYEREGAPLSDFIKTCLASPDLEMLMDEDGQWRVPVPAGVPDGPGFPGWEPGDVIWRCAPREMPGFYMFLSEVNLARWVDQKYLDEQRGNLPAPLYRRLHKNRMRGGEAGFLSQEQVEACEGLWGELYGVDSDRTVAKGQSGKGAEEHIETRTPNAGVEAGVYVQICDLGYRHDRTALVVMHKRMDGIIVVDRMDLWEAGPGSEVQIADVEAAMERNWRDYPLRKTVVDEHQFIRTIQAFSMKGISIEGRHFTVPYNHAIAIELHAAIVHRGLAIPQGLGRLVGRDGRISTFKSELVKLIVVPVGRAKVSEDRLDLQVRVKIDHLASEFNDRSIAVGMGIVELGELPVVRPSVRVIRG